MKKIINKGLLPINLETEFILYPTLQVVYQNFKNENLFIEGSVNVSDLKGYIVYKSFKREGFTIRPVFENESHLIEYVDDKTISIKLSELIQSIDNTEYLMSITFSDNKTKNILKLYRRRLLTQINLNKMK